MATTNWIRGPTIGRGSSATVSVAMAGETVFAVKSAELGASHILRREQAIHSLLQSPRVVAYAGHGVTHEDGRALYNIIMEYVEWGTLSDAIKREGGRLEEREIVGHIRGILQGIGYLHSRRLVHCDIKGRNILIGPDGPKIADFGCAKWEDEADRPISGTPLYMAPEVARGEEQGFPADIWAVGCTMMEMAAGWSFCTEAEDPISALYRIAFSAEPPNFPSWLSARAVDFLDKCLKRNPAERWTASQLLKHPFVDESMCNCSSDVVPWNSPTSTLDQAFWESLGDGQIELGMTRFDARSNQLAMERVRLLSSEKRPDWACEAGWTIVRAHDAATGTKQSTDGKQR